MKTLITNYSFNASAKTITFNDYSSISLESVLLITNVTDNVIIYNFSDPTLGGTVLNNVLTLTYNTTSMSNTDDIQIYYDDSAVQPANAGNQQDLSDLVETLNYLASKLEFLASSRVNSASVGTLPSLRVQFGTDSSISSISNISSISGITYFGTTGTGTQNVQLDPSFLVASSMRTASVLGNINNVIVS